MPNPIAAETNKAIAIRPYLLNVMRFLNPRGRPGAPPLCCEQFCRDYNPVAIVEGEVSLCHPAKEFVPVSIGGRGLPYKET